jgi:hypothetical protein
MRYLLAFALAFSFSLLLGCSTTTTSGTESSQAPRFALPQQPKESIRLIIYRPQTLVGMAGRPVVLVNEKRMVTALKHSMLDPGSVFIVDAPAVFTRVTWVQSKMSEPNQEPLVLTESKGLVRYLRWTLKPTYGYLEEVSLEVGIQETRPLRYMGYRNIVKSE